MKKNGFTLIELIAIIVVIAMIAVITVPIILNAIDNSEKGTAINSAYGYRDAINKFYMSKMLDDNEYDAEDGEYDVSFYVEEGLELSGEKASDGWVLIKDGEVEDFSLKIRNYVVTYTSSTDTIEAVKNGDVALTPTQRKIQTYIASLKSVKGSATDIYILPVDGVSSSDVTSGWVALKNGEAIGYSLQVGSKTTSMSTKDDSVEEIVLSLASTYINGLTTPNSETIINVTESGRLKGGFVEYVSNDSNISINDYSLKYEIDGTTKYANYDKTNTELVVENKNHIPGEEINGVKYYHAIWVKSNPVQYHPGYIGTGNNDAIQPHKNCAGETGCQTWYPYSEFIQDGEIYVNMIMDRNTTAASAWVNQDDYMGTGNNPASPSQNSTQNTVGISYPDGKTVFNEYNSYSKRSDKGPLTALKQLHADTDSWNLPLRGNFLTFENNSYAPATNSYINYTINYSGYKARLISAEEVAFVTRKNRTTNMDSWWGLSSQYYYFGSLIYYGYGSQNEEQQLKQQSYSWLFDNTKNCIAQGCTVEDSNTYGYWTSSPETADTNKAWNVRSFGYVFNNGIGESSYYGIRPVITILRSEIE